jgi:hypothetical protein
MNTHETYADPRARIGALFVEAIRGAEAQVGMTIYEYAARKAGVWETRLISDDDTPAANATQFFRLLKCGRWLPLNWYGLPVGYERWPPGVTGARDEAFAHFAVEFPIDPRAVGGVWLYKEDTMLWLYSEVDPESMRTYYKRFARLCEAMDTWRGPIRSKAWLKIKNPAAPGMLRFREEP